MEFSAFKQSIEDGQMTRMGTSLKTLWLDGSGKWDAAHEVVAHLDDRESARIHAYLHRKEGDLWNADYWYNRAGEEMPDLSIKEEWVMLVERFLNQYNE